MKRREFIQTAALAAAGTTLVLPGFSLPASK
ncbi:MAG: twin-arginine translocation signal domain-containing protein [Bacteroidota bacterium]